MPARLRWYTGGVDIEIEVAGPDDFSAAIWPALNVFGMTGLTDEHRARFRIHYDDCRLLGVREHEEWVATLGEYPFELTVPGGRTVPASGVTMAGVLPTHRRRGILTALMRRLLDDAVAKGWPVAVLLASEASIYPRYGYGVATQYARWKVDPRHATFPAHVPDDGSFRLVADPAEATALAEQVWERYRVSRAGLTTRRAWTWEDFRIDLADDRDGMSTWNWVVHHAADGRPDGYAVYRMKLDEGDALPVGSLSVLELVSPSPVVEAALFRFLCGVDLVRTVDLRYRPVDDPLRWQLTDRRQLVIEELNDFLWLRVLDVPATLSARTYGTTDTFVLDVDDPFRPASGGRFRLATRPDGAACERVERAAVDGSPVDLTMDTSSLASLVLGTVSPSVLAASGRIEAAPEVLGRADACFATGLAPFALTDF